MLDYITLVQDHLSSETRPPLNKTTSLFQWFDVGSEESETLPSNTNGKYLSSHNKIAP